MTSDNKEREILLQCPYCTRFQGGPGVRMPKTIGKYKVRVIYGDILKFTCARCAKDFKMIMGSDKQYLWSTMTRKECEAFKTKHYKLKREDKK